MVYNKKFIWNKQIQLLNLWILKFQDQKYKILKQAI